MEIGSGLMEISKEVKKEQNPGGMISIHQIMEVGEQNHNHR